MAILLHEIAERGLHIEAGFVSIGQYAEQLLGISAGKAKELLHLARRLEGLPVVREAFKKGEVGWTKCREISKVATAETQGYWLEMAREMTSRQLEGLIRATDQREEAIQDLKKDSQVKRRQHYQVTLHLRPEILAMLEEVKKGLMKDLERRSMELEEVIEELCQRELEGKRGEGIRRELILYQCPTCGDAWQETFRGKVAVDEELAERALCDGAVVDLSRGLAEAGEKEEPGSSLKEMDDGAVAIGGNGEEHELSGSETMVVARAIGDDENDGKESGRLTRTFPPRIRRNILRRDGDRCQAPHCGGQRFLELHHIRPYSEGGKPVKGNGVTVCSTHHHLLHNGMLAVRRKGDGNLDWYHPLVH